MRQVITVHGISSNGAWQEVVRDVLEPHFECVSIRYPQYLCRGFSKVLIGSPFIDRAADDVHAQYDAAKQGYGLLPHLIAHSFGTVLAARLMRKPLVYFDRVIFAGSALNETYDWEGILDQGDERFTDLRNEHGSADRVVAVARIATLVKPYLGGAGREGFRGPYAHDLNGPMVGCDLCDDQRARIHNAPLRGYEHSEYFLRQAHASDLWLPFLWGLEPRAYQRFLRLCAEAEDSETREDYIEQLGVENSLRTITMHWGEHTGGDLTLEEYVALVLAEHMDRLGRSLAAGDVARLAPMVVREVWRAVARAVAEQSRPRGLRRADVVRMLRPTAAVRRAVGEFAEKVLVGLDP